MADVIIFANSAMLTLKPEIIHLRNPHFNIKQDTHGTSIKQCFFYRFRQSLPKVLRQKQNSHKTDYFIPKRALELPTPSPRVQCCPDSFKLSSWVAKNRAYNIARWGMGE